MSYVGMRRQSGWVGEELLFGCIAANVQGSRVFDSPWTYSLHVLLSMSSFFDIAFTMRLCLTIRMSAFVYVKQPCSWRRSWGGGLTSMRYIEKRGGGGRRLTETFEQESWSYHPDPEIRIEVSTFVERTPRRKGWNQKQNPCFWTSLARTTEEQTGSKLYLGRDELLVRCIRISVSVATGGRLRGRMEGVPFSQ